MSDLKRFEEWEKVDCNECSHYWDSSCDGVSKGNSIGCNSYLATRSVVIPEKINRLENDVHDLKMIVLAECILIVMSFILLAIFGG